MPARPRPRARARYSTPGDRVREQGIRTLIKLYRRLSTKLDLGCRIIEADKLLRITRDMGTESQKATVFGMLNAKFGMLLGCHCDDANCPHAVEIVGGQFDCNCRILEKLDCASLYVYGYSSGDHHTFYPPGHRPS
jgi:hypothetical protein